MLKIASCCLILLALVSCGKMEDPVLNSIENIKVNKFGLGTTVMTFDVHYFNPNRSGGKMKDAAGDAWLDSNYIGHFHVDTVVNIPPKADFFIPVKLDVDTKFLLRYTIAGLKNEDVLVTINGKARVGKGGVYKNFPLHYEGKQNLTQLIK